MRFEEFELERNQSLYENEVDYNLSESGVHPLKISEILTKDEQAQILDKELLYGYTNGTPQLRKRVIDIYDKDLSLENVLITSGSAEANFLSIMTQLDAGDEIVYMVPNYLQIYHLARSLGIKVKTLPIRQELGWQWDPDELKRTVSSKTKMIVVCNPNNPTGAIMNSQIMDKVIEIAKEQLRAEGKPEAMLENIAKGKLKKFFKDNTLINQAFIKDNKMSVIQYIKSVNSECSITDFKRVSLV